MPASRPTEEDYIRRAAFIGDCRADGMTIRQAFAAAALPECLRIASESAAEQIRRNPGCEAVNYTEMGCKLARIAADELLLELVKF